MKLGCAGVAGVLLMCLVCVPQARSAEAKAVPRDKSLLLESRAAVDRACRFLAGKQNEDGSWKDDPAITGLVVTAMVGSGLDDYGPDSKPVGKGLAYVRKFARPDGGIYGKFYPNYTTSVCVMALIEAGHAEDKDIIRRARGFLLELQADEGEGFAAKDADYGGWGYEKDPAGEGMHRADMSNTQLALEAVHALQQAAEEDEPDAAAGEGRTKTELCFDKAVAYLDRCQSDDGGFIYRPDESKAGAGDDGRLRSYGSMTYAGLKSMIYARLDRDDKRVRAAYEWACKHWSVTENPVLGAQGLYYYYQTMAKALNAYGAEIIVDAEGKKHDWRRELVAQLLKVQREDGSWVNENGRWMETMPELVTAYAVLAIGHTTAKW